jgi:L-iditol 2-dehydrogenase
MWAKQLIGPGRFEDVETPSPQASDLKGNQVLLRVTAGGICGSDLPFFFGHGEVISRPGFPMHEVVGEVLASNHPGHRPKDMVVGWASEKDAIAEFVVTDGDMIAGYPSNLSVSTAVMLQPLACVLFAVDQIPAVTGARCAVLGQGPIGLLFTHVLKSAGALSVTAVDVVDRSVESTKFGADQVVQSSSEKWALTTDSDERPSIVVEAIGHQTESLSHAVDGLAIGGSIYYFGIPDGTPYPLDMMMFLRKNLTLRAGVTLERRRYLQLAGEYLGNHPEVGDGYISHTFAFDEVQAAFDLASVPRSLQSKIVLSV